MKILKAYVRDFAEVDLKISTDNLHVDTEENGKLNIQGKVGDTNIETNGYSEVFVGSIKAKSLAINAKGNSTVTTQGQSQDFDITAIEFSKINAEKFSAKNTTIKASGNTETSISSTDKLDVKAIDFAAVKYSGSPEITKEISPEASLQNVRGKVIFLNLSFYFWFVLEVLPVIVQSKTLRFFYQFYQ